MIVKLCSYKLKTRALSESPSTSASIIEELGEIHLSEPKKLKKRFVRCFPPEKVHYKTILL